MKNLITLILFFCSITLLAQKADSFTGSNNDRPRNPRADQMNFVPNEVLVKFKDEVTLTAGTNLKSAGISSVDQVLKANGAAGLEKLFPTAMKLKSAKIVKDPQGRNMKIPNLDNIYKITVPQLKSTGSAPSNIFKFIEDLKALPEVEYAEPNYIYSVDDLKPVGPVLSADDVAKLKKNNLKDAPAGMVPNDPLYSQQGYIQAVKANLVWAQTTGDTTQVIAILDTGVDWNHPDLKNKIWKNPNPATTMTADGILNDIRGWDYVNNDNNPMDDNSHGTHVAGIAAAETNNGIGIAGICPKAKIMPIKAFTSKGTGDVATIVKGINYASTHGATVINMSFGSYAPSLTMETALLNAYPSAILVAAAGNDSHSIYDILPSGLPATFYPAALSYVFGVQSDGSYSNFDPDGPVYSESADGINYELKAPGSAISTVPNGNYRELTGTSMATPIVSGSVALYRSFYPGKSLEELWSDFIHSSNGIIDLNSVFFSTSKIPQLDLVSDTINDQNDGNDKDNKADAGETVNLILKIRNTGSPANIVYAKIRTANDGNPNDITILKDTVQFGSIGIYRSITNETNPFKIKINNKCNNNSFVSLDVLMHNNVDTTVFIRNIKFKIYNGQELSGILLRDTTFTPDKNWVISNSLRISTGVTLTILPGTSVEILAGVDNRGKVIAVGTPEKRIIMKGIFGGDLTLKYVDIDGIGGSIGRNWYDMNRVLENCNITNLCSINAKKISNSKIYNSFNGSNSSGIDTLYHCLIENCDLGSGLYVNLLSESTMNNFWNAFTNTQIRESRYNIYNQMINVYVKSYPHNNNIWYSNPTFLFYYNGGNDSYQAYGDHGSASGIGKNKIIKNSFLNNGITTYYLRTDGSADMVTLEDQYWGSNNPEKIKAKYYDFNDNAGVPYFNIEPKLIAPSDSCPGHVWKVLVNGKDAQDEVVDPLGVGKHRFDVYFNRAMNKDSIPQVTFGGIYPYTSNKINENASWSADGKIYTVYKTIKLTTGDGINQIRIADAKQAGDWGWKIPIEDSRFSFIISAANSASMDFIANPGLGKVKLEWNNNDLTDGLGFNMYRMEQVNDSVLTNPVLINSTLITDTLYTDFAVTPNKKYYYYYKILRTNLSETDSSKVVSATPFTAAKGDANGDLAVNVLDITTIVAYLLNNNPQPFITEAADYNSDGSINVLDIVAVVNLILGKKSAGIASNEQIHLYLQNDTLFADAPVAIGGIQFDISGTTSVEEIQKLKALEGFESGYAQQENNLRLLYFSMSGKTIPAGDRIPLLKLKKGSGITEAIFADKTGTPISYDYLVSGIGKTLSNPEKLVAELGQNYPNPLNRLTTIPIRIYEPVDEAVIRIFNVNGQELGVIRLQNPSVGEHLIQWDSGIHKGWFVYLLGVRQGKKQIICPSRKMIVQ